MVAYIFIGPVKQRKVCLFILGDHFSLSQIILFPFQGPERIMHTQNRNKGNSS